MNRRYLVPATIAALLHAGLLCGGRSAPASLLATAYLDEDWVCALPPRELFASDELVTEDGTIGEGVTAPIAVVRSVALPRDFTVDVPAPTIPDAIVCCWPPGLVMPLSDVAMNCCSAAYVYEAGDLDRLPRARAQAVPIYPYEARTAGVSGEVLVEFIVDEAGDVLEPHVRRSTSETYSKSALAAVALWKFEPGRRAGEVVRYRMTVPIVFTLTDAP